MDKVWKEKDFASFFTFDPRWYDSLPPYAARTEQTEERELAPAR